MSVGGNQSASEYFGKQQQGSSSSSNDARVKYTSRAGQQYKKVLEKRAAEDAIAYVNNLDGGGVILVSNCLMV